MESQVLIQFPDSLAKLINKEYEINNCLPIDSSFQWKDTKLYFVFKSQEFETKLFDLPTLIESYKRATASEIDKIKKIYKTNNISQVLRVFDENEQQQTVFQEVCEKIMNSGITPPTQWIKPNMFLKKKKLSKNEILLNEILERDNLSDFVDFELKNLEEEVLESDFINEIETELIKNEPKPSKIVDTSHNKLAEKEDIKSQIKELTDLMNGAPNSIIKNRFQATIDELKKQLDEQ